MDSKTIPERDLATTYIGETGVTVLDVICALCDAVDGGNVYDIQYVTGLSLERCHRISETRYAVQPIWLKQ